MFLFLADDPRRRSPDVFLVAAFPEALLQKPLRPLECCQTRVTAHEVPSYIKFLGLRSCMDWALSREPRALAHPPTAEARHQISFTWCSLCHPTVAFPLQPLPPRIVLPSPPTAAPPRAVALAAYSVWSRCATFKVTDRLTEAFMSPTGPSVLTFTALMCAPLTFPSLLLSAFSKSSL